MYESRSSVAKTGMALEPIKEVSFPDTRRTIRNDEKQRHCSALQRTIMKTIALTKYRGNTNCQPTFSHATILGRKQVFMPKSRLSHEMQKLSEEWNSSSLKIGSYILIMLTKKMSPLIAPTDTVKFSIINAATSPIPARKEKKTITGSCQTCSVQF